MDRTRTNTESKSNSIRINIESNIETTSNQSRVNVESKSNQVRIKVESKPNAVQLKAEELPNRQMSNDNNIKLESKLKFIQSRNEAESISKTQLKIKVDAAPNLSQNRTRTKS